MTRNQLTPLQERWLTALESGEYKQCRETLYDGEGYCCLGVATHLVDPKHYDLLDENIAPADVYPKYHLRTCEGGFSGTEMRHCAAALTALNDKGHTFPQIAAIIRAEPWLVFTNFDIPENAERVK